MNPLVSGTPARPADREGLNMRLPPWVPKCDIVPGACADRAATDRRTDQRVRDGRGRRVRGGPGRSGAVAGDRR
eukprot:744618-Prymnesium_polylepis.1